MNWVLGWILVGTLGAVAILYNLWRETKQDADQLRTLVSDGLFLCMYGERPPGAPLDPEAETWNEWGRRAERYLRRDEVQDPAS